MTRIVHVIGGCVGNITMVVNGGEYAGKEEEYYMLTDENQSNEKHCFCTSLIMVRCKYIQATDDLAIKTNPITTLS